MKKRNILTVILMILFISLYFCSGIGYAEELLCLPTGLLLFESFMLVCAAFVLSKWIADKICNVPTEHSTIYSVVKWTLYIAVSVIVIIAVGCIGKFYGVDIVDVYTWRGNIVIIIIAAIMSNIIDNILPKFIKK